MSVKFFLKRPVIVLSVAAFLIAIVAAGKFGFISEAESRRTMLVPNLTATKTVSLFTDNDSDGKADPGDTLQYSVTINNAGTDATGVVLNDTLNLSTLSGVANISPLAANDTYNTIGNVNIAFPDGAGDLLSNDADVDGGTVTLTGFGNTLPGANANAPGATITTTNGGSLKVNANGSFDYNPPRGAAAAETFFYTISDGQGGTDTSQVTINLSGRIWFINNAAGACSSSCDGRLTNPYTTATAFQTANTGTGSNPAAGDYIFIYSGTGNYNGSLTLLNNQKLIGQGASANILSVTGLSAPSGANQLPGTGSAPTLGTTVASTNAVTIANAASATIRGLTIGNTTGTKIITSPNPPSSAFGTLTISEVALNGTGQALNLDNGTLAATFTSIASTSSSAQGVALEQVGGSLTSTGGTTVSGNATQCVLITASTANINLGNTSCTGGTDGISLQNNSAGTRTFGTISVTNNSGAGYLHSNAGGAANVTGAAALTNPAGRCIDIQDSTTAVIFANVNCTGSGGTGVFLDDNSGNVTFADLDISPDNNQRAFQATAGNTGAITTTSGTIATTNAAAIDIAGTSAASRTPLNIQLTSVSANGGTNGISLTNTAGSFAVSGDGASDTANTTRGRVTAKLGGGTITLGSGGTISNTTAASILLLNTGSVVLRNMTIQNGGGDGVASTTVAGLTADNMLISGKAFGYGLHATSTSDVSIIHSDIGNNATDASVPALDIRDVGLDNVSGTTTILASLFHDAAEHIFVLKNTTATTVFNVTNSTFSGAQAGDGLDVYAFGSSNVTANIQNISSINNSSFGIDSGTETTQSATLNITVNGSTFSNNFVGVAVAHGSSGTNTFSITNNNFQNQDSVSVNINRLGAVSFTGFGLFSGTISGNTIGTAGLANSGSVLGTNAIDVKTNGNGGTIRVAIINNTLREIGNDGIRVIGRDANTGHTLQARIQNNNIANFHASALSGVRAELGAASGDKITMCLNITSNTVTGAPQNGIRVRSVAGGSPPPVITLTMPGWDGSGSTYLANQNPAAMGILANTSFANSNAGSSTTAGTCTAPANPPPAEALNFEITRVEKETSTFFGKSSFEPTDIFTDLQQQDLAPYKKTNREEIVSTVNMAAAKTETTGTEHLESFATFFTDASNLLAEFAGKLDSMLSPTVYAQEKESPVPEAGSVSTNSTPFTLPAGKSVKITFKATVDNGPFAAGVNNITNQAQISGTNFAAVNSTTSSIALDAAPDLQISSTDLGAKTQPGGTISYTLNYQNVTSIRTQGAAGVVVSHIVPPNTTFNAASSTAGWTCANNAPAGTNCTFTVGAVNASGSGFVTFALNVLDALPADVQQLSTTATIADDGANGTDLNTADNSGNETTPIVGNWLGDASSDWFAAANWSSGEVPPAGNNISVPPAVPTAANQPNIPAAGSDVSIGKLTLNGGNLTIGAGRTLTAGGNVTIGANLVSGAGTLALGSVSDINRTTGQVESILKKTFGGAGAFTFPVGTNTTQYSPVNVTVTAGAGDLSVKANAGTAPANPAPLDAAKSLMRYWTLNGSGITSDVTFNYLNGDVPGTANENAFQIVRVQTSGSPVVRYQPNGSTLILNPAGNFFTVKNLSTYSNWTLAEALAPTAANVNVGGRLLDENGRAVSNAQIAMVDANGSVRLSRSNPFGYYRFDSVAVGATYTISITHKLYEFPARVLVVMDDSDDVDFVGSFR